MFNRITFYNNPPGAMTLVLLLIGTALIGFGLLVFFVPEILVAMVSGILILAGSGFLTLAWRSRQAVNDLGTWHDEF